MYIASKGEKMNIYPSRPRAKAHCHTCKRELQRGEACFRYVERFYQTQRYTKYYICKDCIHNFLENWIATYCEDYWDATEYIEPQKRVRRQKYANPSHNLISQLSYYRKRGNQEKYDEVLRQLLPF